MHRIAVVTGGTSGIGLATSLALAKAGYEVRVTYREQQQKADELLADGTIAMATQLELGDVENVENWVHSEGRNFLEGVGVLINNAGEILRPGDWESQGPRDMVATFSMHAISPVLLTRAVVGGMRSAGWGRVVFTSSTYGLTGAGGVLAYASAKASIVSSTYALARDLGKDGITVNCVVPGNIDTPMTSGAGPEIVEWVESTTPLSRLGMAEEVAQQTLYFLEAGFVTGQVAIVDGGQILNM